jgi:hypothetical protein
LAASLAILAAEVQIILKIMPSSLEQLRERHSWFEINAICHENVNLRTNHYLAGRTFSTFNLATDAEKDFDLNKPLHRRTRRSAACPGARLLMGQDARSYGRSNSVRAVGWCCSS